jgi:hypothetical protein
MFWDNISVPFSRVEKSSKLVKLSEEQQYSVHVICYSVHGKLVNYILEATEENLLTLSFNSQEGQ